MDVITQTFKLANIFDLIAAAPSGVNQSNNYTQSKADSGSGQGAASEGAASSYKELEPAAAATAENDSTSSIPTKTTPVVAESKFLPTKAVPDNESSEDKCATGRKLQNAVVVHVHSVPE